MTTKPRGGGVKALVVGPLKKEFFFAASLSYVTLFEKATWNWVAKHPPDENPETVNVSPGRFIFRSL